MKMSKAASCIAIFLALDDEEGKKNYEKKYVDESVALKKINKFTHEKPPTGIGSLCSCR